MREIKFRAWNWKEKEMGWVAILDIDGGWVTVGVDPDLQENSVGCEQQAVDWDIQYVKLMQFTGLKDKNGKEIYEGDIVKYQFTREIICEIKWDEWEEEMSTGIGFQLPWFYEKDEIEVIGNIYENPELLKEK